MKQIALKDTKPGELVKLKPSESAPVWKRGAFDRSTGRYSLSAWDDINRETLRKGSTLVYTGFTF